MPFPLARLLAAVAGSMFVLLATPAPAQTLPALFAEGAPTVGTASPPAAVPMSRLAVRQRIVRVDLARIAPSQPQAPTLAVALFDGNVAAVDFVRIEVRGPGNFTWYGRVRDYDRGDVVLTVVDGMVAGGIGLATSGNGQARSYLLESLPDGRQLLQELDPALLPPEHPPGWTGEAPAGTLFDTPSLTSQADTGGMVDIMIVYSDQTAAGAGAAIGATVQYAVDRTNLAYTNSGVATQLRLVYSGAAGYSESGDFSTDLSRLQGTADGYLDNVHALRDTYAADLVSLIIENNAYCGIGYINSTATSAFTVVNRGCSGGNLSLAHEVGHNFGARHDPYVDAATTPYAYGHGYVYKTGMWRTVMAYDNECNASGFSCSRLPYFSNPNVSYGGVPMGTVTTHNNARVHNDRAVTVANFRVAGSVTAPTASTSPATAVASNGATLNGTVSSNGASTTVTFDYGTTTGYGNSATAGGSPLAAGASAAAVSTAITGLAACTTYHFRVVAANSAGTTNGADAAFTTGGCVGAPTVTPSAPGGVTTTGATLNGTVRSDGAAATVTFKYGLTSAYGSTVTAAQSPVTTSGSPATVSAIVTGLLCGTTYHWALAAGNSGGNAQSPDQAFTTTACGGALAPTVTTLPPSTLGAGNVFNGMVSSNGAATTVAFQFGTSGFGDLVQSDQGTLPASASNQPVSATLFGLACGTSYQYRVVASSTGGTATGNGVTFTTPACGTGAISTTTLDSTANPAVAGTTVTVMATVTGNAPTGPVLFRIDSAVVPGCGAVPLVGSGNTKTAICALPPQAAGTYPLLAQYAGDVANAPSHNPVALAQSMVAAGTLVGTVITNPYGPMQVTGGTLVGSTLSITGSSAVLQLGNVAGGSTPAEIDFAGLHLAPGTTLTLRSGAGNQQVLLKNTNGEASAIAGSIVAQGGSGASPPQVRLWNANGIALGATASLQAPGGLVLDALQGYSGNGGSLTNAGVVDGGAVLGLFAATIRGAGAWRGNEVDIHATRTVNNPVSGAHYLGNSLQLYPGTGSDVNVLVNAFGDQPQFINLKINGNALVWMPSAWPGTLGFPPSSAPLPPGFVRPPGGSEPTYGGGSIIVQSTGAMTLYRGGSNDLVFPGGIALKAGGTLNLDGVRINQGWTTTGKAFQGIYLEAPQIVSATPVEILSNDLNWINFSVLPTGSFRIFRLQQQADGTALYVPADLGAPHRNTYSTLIDAAAELQCWTCLVDYAPINVQ